MYHVLFLWKQGVFCFHFLFSVGLTGEKLVWVCFLFLVLIFKIQKCGYDYKKWKQLFGIFIFSKYEVSGILVIKWIRVGPICLYQNPCKILKSHPMARSHFPSPPLSLSHSLLSDSLSVSSLSLSHLIANSYFLANLWGYTNWEFFLFKFEILVLFWFVMINGWNFCFGWCFE